MYLAIYIQRSLWHRTCSDIIQAINTILSSCHADLSIYIHIYIGITFNLTKSYADHFIILISELLTVLNNTEKLFKYSSYEEY